VVNFADIGKSLDTYVTSLREFSTVFLEEHFSILQNTSPSRARILRSAFVAGTILIFGEVFLQEHFTA
jgi:hypothetical protein